MQTNHKAWWAVFLLGLGVTLLSSVPARAGDKKTLEEKKQAGKEEDPKQTGPASIFKGKATPLAWKDGKVRYEGELTATDPLAQEHYFKLFAIQLEAGKTYRFDMKHNGDPEFDSYLYLEDANGKKLAHDDDGGDGRNALIIYKISTTGQYRLIASTFPKKQTGKFTLEVSLHTSIFKGKATPLAWKDGKVSYQGELTAADPLAKERYYKLFTIQLEAGKTYHFDMKSNGDPKFDSYLYLEDADGQELAHDDDGGDGRNARLMYEISTTGQYRLIATTYPNKQTGKFTLEVSFPSVNAEVVDEKELKDLGEAVRKLFEQKGFAPRMIPGGPFTLKEFDPLLIQAQWAQVRPDLELLYQRTLKLKGRPDLRLRFLSVDDPTWQKLGRLRIVLRDPGKEIIRKLLLASLSLPERSFEATGTSKQSQTTVVYIKVDASKQVKAMDLGAIRAAIDAELGAAKSPFHKLKLTPLEGKQLQKNAGVQLFSRWVFLREVEEPRPQLYYWRVSIRLEKTTAEGGGQLETWVFQTVAEIGRKTPKDKEVALIQNTDMEADFSEWLAGTLQKPPQKSGTYEKDEGPRIVQVGRQFPKNGKPGYYTNPQKEGPSERFIQEAPLAQAANNLFHACYKRLLQETGWKLQ